MGVTRRQFLTGTGAATLGAVIFSGCGVPDRKMEVQSPISMPEDLVTGIDNVYATLCQNCSSNEGILVRVVEGRAKKIQGNPDYPTNQGKHSARCEAGLQLLYSPDRIQGPMERSGGELLPIDWETAINILAGKLKEAQGLSGSTVMITEPGNSHLSLLVSKFIDSYKGHHIRWEPLEQTVLREAIKKVFGQDQIPDFQIEKTNHLLSFGSDFLGTWLSPVRYSRGYGEFRQGDGRKRGTLVQIEPRFSLTAANADNWVPVNPGMEGLLALSMAYVIISDGNAEASIADAITGGDGLAALEQYKPENVESHTGVSHVIIQKLARDFVDNQPGIAIGGGSAAAHTNGLFNLTWIYALNLLVGNVGKSGGIIFNPDPPLKELKSIGKVSSFGDLLAVRDRLNAGETKLALIHNANPSYALPGSVGFGEALSKAYVVSFSSFMDETTAQADLILPDHVYLEDWGSNIPEPGPGYQTVGFQQPVVRPYLSHSSSGAGGTRSFPNVLLDVSKRVGGNTANQISNDNFLEFLQAEAHKLFKLNRGSITSSDFREFWNGILQRGGWWDTDSKKRPPMKMSAPKAPAKANMPSYSSASEEYPYYMIPFPSISLMDGRGANLPWLQATPDPLTTVTWKTWVELNPKTASSLDVSEGDIIRVTSSEGYVESPVYIHPAAPPNVISIPFGQGHTSFGNYAEDRGENVFSILAPTTTDGSNKALAWASTRVKIEKTGTKTTLPKFEGTQLAVQLEGSPIIQIERSSGS